MTAIQTIDATVRFEQVGPDRFRIGSMIFTSRQLALLAEVILPHAYPEMYVRVCGCGHKYHNADRCSICGSTEFGEMDVS